MTVAIPYARFWGPLQFDTQHTLWDESDHPRDESGKFTEGSEVAQKGEVKPVATVQSTGDAKRLGVNRSRKAVHFDQPIVGPSGAKLNSYDWRWMFEESPEQDDPRRVSDWGQSELNEQTGRDVVHVFHVTTPDGQHQLASLESALKLLGFGVKDAGLGKVKNLATAAMKLAEHRQKHEKLLASDPATYGLKYKIDASNAEMDRLEKRVQFLEREAHLAAKTGQKPADKYRATAGKLQKLRDFFHTVGKNRWQGPEFEKVAKTATKRPAGQHPSDYERYLVEQMSQLYHDLAVASRTTTWGDTTNKTPIHEEIPERMAFGSKIPAKPAWSDAKMRNWYAEHGEGAEKAIEAAEAFIAEHFQTEEPSRHSKDTSIDRIAIDDTSTNCYNDGRRKSVTWTEWLKATGTPQ